MDSRDLIVLGLVGVGGYFAYRWWTGRPITNAENTAPNTVDGAAASSMTETAARTTVFGASKIQKLLGTFNAVPAARLMSPTAPAGQLAAEQLAAFKGEQAKVSNAVLAPAPNAPSPNNFRYSSTGVLAPVGTQPDGEQPQPGDPSKFFIQQTRGFA